MKKPIAFWVFVFVLAVVGCGIVPSETTLAPTLANANLPTSTGIAKTQTPILITATIANTATMTPTATVEPTPTAPSLPASEIIFGQKFDKAGRIKLELLTLPSLNFRDLLDPDRFPGLDVGSLSADGRYLAFDDFTRTADTGALDIYILSLIDGTLEHLRTGIVSSGDPVWSHDGTQLAFIGSNSVTSPASMFAINMQTRFVIQLTWSVVPWYGPVWAPDDQSVAYIAEDENGLKNLYLVSLARKLYPISLGRCDAAVTWSPDGQTLVCLAEIDGNVDIYAISADSHVPPVRLTTNTGNDRQPTWSPDGKFIAFASKSDNKFNIYRMNTDGTNKVQLTHNSLDNEFPRWSLDGRYIFYISGTPDNAVAQKPEYWDLYAMTIDGGNNTRLAQNVDSSFAIVGVDK